MSCFFIEKYLTLLYNCVSINTIVKNCIGGDSVFHLVKKGTRKPLLYKFKTNCELQPYYITKNNLDIYMDIGMFRNGALALEYYNLDYHVTISVIRETFLELENEGQLLFRQLFVGKKNNACAADNRNDILRQLKSSINNPDDILDFIDYIYNYYPDLYNFVRIYPCLMLSDGERPKELSIITGSLSEEDLLDLSKLKDIAFDNTKCLEIVELLSKVFNDIEPHLLLKGKSFHR